MRITSRRRAGSLTLRVAAAAAGTLALLVPAGSASANTTHDDENDGSYHCDWGGNGYGCAQYGYGDTGRDHSDHYESGCESKRRHCRD